MLGFNGPAQPSPMLGDALNAGYRYLEVRCLGCDTNQTVVLDIVRRPNANPRARAVHALQGLLEGARLFIQAQTSGRAAIEQDHGKRSAVGVVAGRAMNDSLLGDGKECRSSGGLCFAAMTLTSKTGAKCSSRRLTLGSRYMVPIIYCDQPLLTASHQQARCTTAS
jgi:hypothetical protein